jgi:hypothetical protein
MVRELITHGADVNIQNNVPNRAIDVTENQEIITLLLQHGSNPRTRPLQESQEQIDQTKQIIITNTNEAILADTSIPENINLNDLGCDVIISGCADSSRIKIQDFINENPENSVVIKFATRHFLFTKDDLNHALQSSVVYPCLKANNIPGRDSNVITTLPLYSLATVTDARVLVKRDTFDAFIAYPGNVFIVVDKNIYSYPSISSHNVVFEQGGLVSGLHCNAAEPEKLYSIKRVNLPIQGGYREVPKLPDIKNGVLNIGICRYYNKLQKYLNKLKV